MSGLGHEDVPVDKAVVVAAQACITQQGCVDNGRGSAVGRGRGREMVSDVLGEYLPGGCARSCCQTKPLDCGIVAMLS